MTVLFSRKCEYAVQSMLYLAEHIDSGPISADRIAEDLAISRDFVSKTLQGLVGESMVRSIRGKAGGFLLAREPGTINLLSIVLVVDGDSVFESCVLGLPSCGSEEPCPVHETWGPLREAARRMLERTTLEAFMKKSNGKALIS